MPKYRKKPVVIEAVKWDGKLTTVEPLLAGSSCRAVEQNFLEYDLIIPTLEGQMTANVGDYIIKGVKGELYPCKSDIFEQTYELAE